MKTTEKALSLAGELIAMIRLNAMRGTFASASVEEVEEHMKPWIERLKEVQEEARTLADGWVDAEKFLPMGPHEVLATDGEGRFLAFHEDGEWWDHALEERCDSQVLYWQELPEVPEC